MIDDLDYIVESKPFDVGALYDAAASRYEHFRDLWLQLVGQPAEDAMLRDLRAFLRPGMRVLDAGAGTGSLARLVHDIQPEVELTLVEISPRMLALASDVPANPIVASVVNLPFPDASFDVVASAWVIETLADPGRAVQEYLRVLSPEGRVVYTFCSLPDGWFSRAGSLALRAAVMRGFAGSFLPGQQTPWHECGLSHRASFRAGLTAEILLAKCCNVDAAILTTTGPGEGRGASPLAVKSTGPGPWA